jgi:hypothetical protein
MESYVKTDNYILMRAELAWTVFRCCNLFSLVNSYNTLFCRGASIRNKDNWPSYPLHRLAQLSLRPWRPMGFWEFEVPPFSRQSTHIETFHECERCLKWSNFLNNFLIQKYITHYCRIGNALDLYLGRALFESQDRHEQSWSYAIPLGKCQYIASIRPWPFPSKYIKVHWRYIVWDTDVASKFSTRNSSLYSLC